MSNHIRKDHRVVLLCQDGMSSRAVFAALQSRYSDLLTLVEEPVPRTRFLQGRVKRLGPTVVLGQALLMTAIVPILHRKSKHRIREIRETYGLSDAPIEGPGVVRVPSVNSGEVRQKLRAAAPRVVVVNGTRIIRSATLRAIDAPFINTHHGITPAYRGVHGGYWALTEGYSDLVGSTIHYVDEGIDTGEVIRQVYFRPTARDNFATYPYLHIGTALPALLEVVEALCMTGTCSCVTAPDIPSKLHSHPTAWEYLLAWRHKGVS